MIYGCNSNSTVQMAEHSYCKWTYDIEPLTYDPATDLQLADVQNRATSTRESWRLPNVDKNTQLDWKIKDLNAIEKYVIIIFIIICPR